MKWTLVILLEEALKYKTRGEFQKESPRAYDSAHGRSLLDTICGHMIRTKISWNEELIQKESLKWKTRQEFRKGNRKSYTAAIRSGIIDKICSHMPPPSNEAYTEEEIRHEISKHLTRGDFLQNNSSAYNAAIRLGILDDVCKHMKRSALTSKQELKLFEIIKSKYPNAKKIRDMTVAIPNKPYIHGFDIDIFIPELNKGIEFDGAYRHSFDVMRKSKAKRKWSDEDIRNYHELKDAWFALKGIQIIHIKDTDWKNNKEECVDRCLKFLSERI